MGLASGLQAQAGWTQASCASVSGAPDRQHSFLNAGAQCIYFLGKGSWLHGCVPCRYTLSMWDSEGCQEGGERSASLLMEPKLRSSWPTKWSDVRAGFEGAMPAGPSPRKSWLSALV